MDFHRLRVVNFDTNVGDTEPRHKRDYDDIAYKVNDNVSPGVKVHLKEISHGGGDGLVSKTASQKTTTSKDTTSLTRGSKNKYKSNKKRIRFRTTSLCKLNRALYIPRKKLTKRSIIGRESKGRKHSNRNRRKERQENAFTLQTLFTHERGKSQKNVNRRSSLTRRDRNRHLIYGNSKSSHDVCGFRSSLLNPYVCYQYSCSEGSSNFYQNIKNKLLHKRKNLDIKKCCNHFPLKVIRSLSLRNIKSESSCKDPDNTWCPYNLVNFIASLNPSPRVSSNRLYKDHGMIKDIGYQPPAGAAGKDQATRTSSRMSQGRRCANVCVETSQISFAPKKYDNVLCQYSKSKHVKPERKDSSVNKMADEFRERTDKVRRKLTRYLETNVYLNRRTQANKLASCILISIFVIVWSPCVLVAMLGWALTSPLTPSKALAARNERLQRKPSECSQGKPQTSRCMITSPLATLSNVSHKCIHMYRALFSFLTGHKRDQHKNKRSHNKFRSPHPDPQKKYTLFYHDNRGWMAKPIRDEKLTKINKYENMKRSNCCKDCIHSIKARNGASTITGTHNKHRLKDEKMVKRGNKKSLCCDVSHYNKDKIFVHKTGQEPVKERNERRPLNRSYGHCSSAETAQPQNYINPNSNVEFASNVQPPGLACECSHAFNPRNIIHPDCTCDSNTKLNYRRTKIVENKSKPIDKKKQRGKNDRCQQCNLRTLHKSKYPKSCSVDSATQQGCKCSYRKSPRKIYSIIDKLRLITLKLQRFTKKQKYSQSLVRPLKKTSDSCKQPKDHKRSKGAPSECLDIPFRNQVNESSETKQLCQCEGTDIKIKSQYTEYKPRLESNQPQHCKTNNNDVQSTLAPHAKFGKDPKLPSRDCAHILNKSYLSELSQREAGLDHTLSKLSKLARKYELPASKVGTRPRKNISHPGSRQVQLKSRRKSEPKLTQSSSCERIQNVKKSGASCPLIFESPRTQRTPKPSCAKCESTTVNIKIEEAETTPKVVTKVKDKAPSTKARRPFLSLDRMIAGHEELFKRSYVSTDRTHPCLLRNYKSCKTEKPIKISYSDKKDKNTVKPAHITRMPKDVINVKKKSHRSGRKKIKGRKSSKDRKVMKGIKVSTKARSRHKYGLGRICKRILHSVGCFLKKMYNFDKVAWPDIPCKDTYLYTLKEKPWFWIYKKCPRVYPCFLSWYRFYQNSCRLMVYGAASVLWCPMFCCLYFCCNFICKCF